MGKITLFSVFLIVLNCVKTSHGIGISEFKNQEHSLEDLDVESLESITPNIDIHYDKGTENQKLDCECGISPSTQATKSLANTRSFNLTRAGEKGQIAPQPFIIGGSPVSRGNIPWMVAITKYQHKKIPRWRVICGGVLLNQRYVLTAAHCIENRYKDTLEVVFNVEDATAISHDPEVIRRKIQRFIIHPSFNSTTIDNDIALIEMKIPLDIEQLKSKIRPVCLPKTQSDYSNRLGTVSGWGYTSYAAGGGGDNSPELLSVMLPILSHENCLKTKVPMKNNITASMFCAGHLEGRQDACINDSGGPLTVQDGETMYLAGLVSWGIGCSLKDYPGVYTKVSNFLPWIKENARSQWCRGSNLKHTWN